MTDQTLEQRIEHMTWLYNLSKDVEEGCVFHDCYLILMEVLTERNALRDAVAWKPIETAPTSTDIICAYEGKIFIASKGHSTGNWYSEYGHPMKTPTHWMPLPEAPNTEALREVRDAVVKALSSEGAGRRTLETALATLDRILEGGK